VAELVPPAHVGWTDVSSSTDLLEGTTIAFDIKSDGSNTALSFVHSAIALASEGELCAVMRRLD